MISFFRPRIGITVQSLAFLLSLSITMSPNTADWVKVHDKNGALCGKNFNMDGTTIKQDGINRKRCSISGIALQSTTKEGRTELVVVHDTRKVDITKVGKDQLGIVTVGTGPVNYRPLTLTTGSLPEDLEAISSVPAVPGQPERFLALSSNGRLSLLTVSIDKDEAAVLSELSDQLPVLQPGIDIEGLSVQNIKGQLVIVWGSRGAGKTDGVLYWGLLDLTNMQIIRDPKTDLSNIRQTFLRPDDFHTRHISDLKIDEGGVVWASTAYDFSDAGPFESALYKLGELKVTPASGKPEVKFTRKIDERPRWLSQGSVKVEGIEIAPGPQGGIFFGAENENMGGWLYFKVGGDWRNKILLEPKAEPNR